MFPEAHLIFLLQINFFLYGPLNFNNSTKHLSMYLFEHVECVGSGHWSIWHVRIIQQYLDTEYTQATLYFLFVYVNQDKTLCGSFCELVRDSSRDSSTSYTHIIYQKRLFCQALMGTTKNKDNSLGYFLDFCLNFIAD